MTLDPIRRPPEKHPGSVWHSMVDERIEPAPSNASWSSVADLPRGEELDVRDLPAGVPVR